MSFFDEVETTVANTRFLQAVEDNGPIVLSLTPYEELKDFECDFVKGLTCRRLLKWESVGYYLFRQFLEKDAEYQKKHIASVTSTQQASPSHTSTHLHPSSASSHDRHECKEDVLSLLQILDDYMRVHEGQRKRHALRVMNNTLHYLKPSDLDKDVIPGEMPSSQVLVKTTSGSISSELSTETMEAIHTVKMQTNMMVHLPEEGSQHRSSRDVEEMKENEKISTPISTPTAVMMMKESKKAALLAADDGRIGPTSSQLDDEVEGSPTVLITTVTPPPSKEGQSKSSFTAPGLPGAANSTPATTTPTASASNTLASASSSTVPTIPPGSSFLSQLLPTCRPILNNIWRQLESSHPPPTLFDPLRDAIADLLHDPFIRFLTTDAYKKYIQLEHYARKTVQLKDFRVFRVLGRGAFGAVSAVQKIDTHAIFAMKEMGKKQVKMNQSEWMVLNEKKVLSKMRSPFVLNLKYSFHNEENLYLIFDMCSGGDLKFHLRGGRDKFFDNDRARFYAAEVLLGLEHIHSFDIVYRDLKPNNILLDMNGHVKISDLGLTIRLRKNKVLKHLAGTAGYWAPEIVMKKGTYKSSDYWSFATFLYEMLAGKRPSCNCQKKTNEWCPFGQKRSMEENALKDDGVLKMEIDYPSDKFTPEAKDLLEKLFEFDPAKRLGANGAHEIKSHPYFSCIDWHALQALEVEPPFIPDGRTVNANSIGEVGEFNKGKFKKIKLTEEDEKAYAGFDYINEEAVQQELVQALKKQDNPSTEPQLEQNKNPVGTGCCVIL